MMKQKEDKIKYCDWCGQKRDLKKVGKAFVCYICEHNQGKKFGTETKATIHQMEPKSMSVRTYSNFVYSDGSKPIMGYFE